MPLDHKYEQKTHFVKLIKQLRGRWDKTQRLTRQNRAAAQARISQTQTQVRELLDSLGIYSDMHHEYMAYAEALEKSQAELAFLVDLIRQHQILRDRFERRALDPEVLDRIDTMIVIRTTDL